MISSRDNLCRSNDKLLGAKDRLWSGWDGTRSSTILTTAGGHCPVSCRINKLLVTLEDCNVHPWKVLGKSSLIIDGEWGISIWNASHVCEQLLWCTVFCAKWAAEKFNYFPGFHWGDNIFVKDDDIFARVEEALLEFRSYIVINLLYSIICCILQLIFCNIHENWLIWTAGQLTVQSSHVVPARWTTRS